MTDDDLPKRVGAALRRARTVAGISKREAARRANVSESTWRNLETGVQQLRNGQTAPMNPRTETVINAARAVGLDPVVVLEMMGRDDVEVYGSLAAPPVPEDLSLAEALQMLTEEIRGLRSDVRRALDRRA